MEFYRFLSFNTVEQPPNSKWCWAACAEQMIHGLNIKSPIGNKQWEILTHYKNNYSPRSTISSEYNPSNETCEFSTLEMLPECNRGLQQEHVKSVFQEMGIRLEPTLTENLKNIDFIKNTLESNDAPILLNVLRSGNKHMILVTGFGFENNCTYIFESDPISKESDHYAPISTYPFNQIIDAWICTIIKEDPELVNLKLDKNIDSNNEDILDLLNNIRSEYNIDLKIITSSDVPINLIEDKSINNPSLAKHYLLSNTSINAFISSEFSVATYCHSIPLLAIPVYDILKSTLLFIKQNGLRNIDLYYEYQKEFGIQLFHRIEGDQVLSFPFQSPNDYKLKKDWQLLDEFLGKRLNLNTLQYFDN